MTRKLSLNLTSICLKYDFSIQTLVKLKQLGEVSVQISDFKYITQLSVIYQPFRRQEEGVRGAVRAEVDRTLWPVKLTRSGEINVRRTDDERSC